MGWTASKREGKEEAKEEVTPKRRERGRDTACGAMVHRGDVEQGC